MNTIEVNNKIYSLFCLKGICAILVVFIHTDFFYRNLFTPISRMAIPLFFAISGYFLVNEKITNKRTILCAKTNQKNW